MAVFWFGQVSPDINSVDVRVGYDQEYLEVRLAVIDRRLWYDPSAAPGELTAWDSATLYIHTGGDAAGVPGVRSYRFDAQLSWWESRAPYQAAFQGNGSGWSAAPVAFVTRTGWRGDEPNNNSDDRGWSVRYVIPFSELGLTAAPPQGMVWGLGLVLHDRDNAGGSPLPDQAWPPNLVPSSPATWGQLFFGTPEYMPPPLTPAGTVLIRQGLNGAVVVDADVGGSTTCGNVAWPGFFPTWGSLNYAGRQFANIQNVGDVADWPCFSRYYVTFPLQAVPRGEIIISATLILHQFGNAGQGYDPGPRPSLIQVLTVGEDWEESTLSWNSAPLALENVAATWVAPLGDPPPPAGRSRRWDVSRAVAEAYAAGEPVRLALYEADQALHGGKYFRTSDYEEYGQADRPTLVVTWGHSLTKTASPAVGRQGDRITYTIRLLGTGDALSLIDSLPAGVSRPESFALEGTTVVPTYDSAQHRLMWSDALPVGQAATISYAVTIGVGDSKSLRNTVSLADGERTRTAQATVVVNGGAFFLPLILR
jgi:hypothetical protein